MKLNAAFRYQLFDHKTSVMVYYIVIVAMSILIGVSLGLFADWGRGANIDVSSDVETLSFTGATAVFLFISGLCAFKENFLFALQSGMSRRTLFLSRLLAFAVLAVFMTVVDYVLGYVFAFIFTSTTGLNLIGAANSSMQAFGMYLLYAFTMLTLGYCLTILFFRLNRTGKILVGAGVPVFFMILLPMFDGNVTGGVIMKAIGSLLAQILRLISSQSVGGYLIIIGAAALFALLSWLMMRRAVVKK